MRHSIDSPLPPARPNWKIAIVRSAYYDDVVTALEEGAKSILMEAGLPETQITSVTVPGAFEIPRAVKEIMHDIDGVITLGVIVQGETFHAQEIARACTDGLMQLQLQCESPPVVHAVLYVHSLDQAKQRCTGKDNKGEEAARTVLQLLQKQKIK